MKQDLTQNSCQELSLLVMNDENLYNARRRSYFKTELDEMFTYTDEQLDELIEDLKAEAIEDGKDVTWFWFGKGAK